MANSLKQVPYWKRVGSRAEPRCARNRSGLAAPAGDLQVRYAATLKPKVLDPELADLPAPQSVLRGWLKF